MVATSFGVQAVVQGMECKARERELVSQLLAHLSPSVLSADQAASGFTRLLVAAEVSLYLHQPPK